MEYFIQRKNILYLYSVTLVTYTDDFCQTIQNQLILMISKNAFLEKIHAGEAAIGTLLTIDSLEVAEILSIVGFDWLFLDMEHGNLSIPSVQQICQVVGDKCPVLVRIPENNGIWIKKVLDIGVAGIIIPHVNSKSEVMNIIKHAKYPPIGRRSVGVGRAHEYGMKFSEYVAQANDHTAIIIQIEDIAGVQNINEIFTVKGIDGVLIGPYDLSGSMNRLGEVTSPEVQAEINKIKSTCKDNNIPFGIFVMSANAVQTELASGCSFVAVGTDSAMLWGRARQVLQTIHDTGN